MPARCISLCLALLAVACSEDVTGPSPELDPPSASADPPPVDPEIICGDQITTEVVVNGSGFSPVPIDIPKAPKAALPSVRVVRGHELDGDDVSAPEEAFWSGDPDADETNAFGGDGGVPLLSWQSQERLTFVVDQNLDLADGDSGRLPAGVYDVTVENANGATATSEAALAVVDRPTVDMVEPTVVCLAQADRTVTLEGESFVEIEGDPPLLRADEADTSFEIAVAQCTDIAHAGVDARFCSTGEAELTRGSLDAELHSLIVDNPETAACSSEEQVLLRVVPAPTVDGISPMLVCVLEVDTGIFVEGSDFLRIDDEVPSVMIDDAAVEVVDLVDCEALETDGHDVDSCSQIDLGMIVADIGLGDHDVTVENPAPAGCSATATGALRVAPPPMVDSLGTQEICSEQMQTVVVTGTDFTDGVRVFAGDVEAEMVEVMSSTQLAATFVEGLPAGIYDITVQIGDGACADTLNAALTVNPSPLVFFVDPPVVYNDLSIGATIFTSGLTANASRVELVDSGGMAIELADFASPVRPNRIQATIPVGLAVGNYDLRVVSNIGCAGSLPGGVTVTDSLGVTLNAVEPGFVSQSSSTAVTLTGTGFASTPRVYLNPTAVGSTATALRAVVFQDAGTLTAVIPEGLAAGDYSVIVVNPDGTVGLLDATLTQGLTVTAAEPPVVTGVVPASLVANTTSDITVSGSDFDTATVVLRCIEPAGTMETVNGVIQGVPTASETVARFNTASVDAGSVCVLRLTNNDGASFRYSAVSITNSSQNLAMWAAGTAMTQARRGLSLVAGRPTQTSRFLFAIGGDDGVANMPSAIGTTSLASVESASVDVFGTMGAWFVQRNALPAARTQAAAAVVGRFVYVVGGHDGTGGTDTIYRAQILDPLAGPEIVDIDAVSGDGTLGLGGGLWLYRVAATFAAGDPNNPSGESPAGEVFNVQLPDFEDKIVLTLDWEPVTGASGYRIYRSPAAGAGLAELELLGTVADGATVSFTDDGAATTAGETPLPNGSLGVWHAFGTTTVKREGHKLVALGNPADATKTFLYALGGRDETGAYLDSYEFATVTDNANGTQALSAWSAGADTLHAPLADFGVWVMSADNTAAIRNSLTPSDVYVFYGSGRTTGGASTTVVEVGKLAGSGDLGTLDATPDDLSANLVGLGTGASNGQLYTFGGETSSTGRSAALCPDATGGCTAAFLDLQPGAWNSLAAAAVDRMFMGSTQESAFFFLAGGHDGVATLSTTQQTVQ